MRVDIFTRFKSPEIGWYCYCEAVTLSNAKRIVATLENQGEHVGLFKHAKVLGKMIYETSPYCEETMRVCNTH